MDEIIVLPNDSRDYNEDSKENNNHPIEKTSTLALIKFGGTNSLIPSERFPQSCPFLKK